MEFRNSPHHGEYYQQQFYNNYSPSPTPSPLHPSQFYPPQRPTTAAHFRHASSGGHFGTASPRFDSTGQYATAAGPSPRVSSRKHSFSKQKHSHSTPKRERRSSYSYYRTSYGDSDEDEVVHVDGVTYVLPAQSRRCGGGGGGRRYQEYYTAAGHGTDYHHYKQGQTYDRERVFYDEPIQRSSTRVGNHGRRASGSVPQRPQTVRPGSSHQQKKAAPTSRAATREDAERYRIPAGYSLKNWDPTEEPIMLLGSIFDSNSLGKWIYDWTVYRHGPGTPISDMAGELWLLLIQLSGKIKRSDAAVPKIRAQENRDMVEDFIESGERLQDKLRILLKRCEAPMLNASKKKENLGKGSGVEFVDTLFGRERELAKTERFMTQTRLWNLRYDNNCSEIVKHPTM
ncbi:vegetative cell wall protein gp1 [Pestalotiopsis sp. NC0098]|nr:vegetative cell wall protein gp1 [Pestalotiopsis sp. NC0098]